jgi:hypothetical protein
MNREEIKSVKKMFDALNEQEQYDWLVKTDLKEKFILYMDNDDTHIYFDDDDQADYCLRFKAYLGTSAGGECIMSAIGVRAQFV